MGIKPKNILVKSEKKEEKIITEKIIEVIKVVIKNFLTILGFFGAPGSFPLRSSLNSMFCDFMPKVKTEKKIIHQIQI